MSAVPGLEEAPPTEASHGSDAAAQDDHCVPSGIVVEMHLAWLLSKTISSPTDDSRDLSSEAAV
jgi:hypothetical protein